MARRSPPGSKLISAALLAAACVIAGCGRPAEKPATAPAPSAPAPSATSTGLPAPSPAQAQKAGPAAPPAVSTAIGRVDALDGDVRLMRAGRERRAEAGMPIEERDTYTAGQESWALLAMTDGASITLRPGSQVRFDTYRYAATGAASENAAVMSLVKGALRSITGLVGKSNPAGYQVKTPSATIGIRGTDHEPAYYPPPAPGEKAEHPPGTYDKVNSGQSIIRSPLGSLPVRPGQTAFAQFEAKAKPQVLSRPPAFYHRQAEIDKRVALRRAQFHRDYDQERQKQAQAIRIQQQEAARKAQDERKAKQQEIRKQNLDARQTQQEKLKAEQQKRKDETKGAAGKSDKGGARKDDRKADERKGKDERKAKDDRKQARDEKKAALPPAVAGRVRNMQRGDKAAPAAAGVQSERRDTRPQPGTPVGGVQQQQRQQSVQQEKAQRQMPVQQEKGQRQQPAQQQEQRRAQQQEQGKAQQHQPDAQQRQRNERENRKGVANEPPAR
ncbi:MAG: hypothetical protein JWO70_1741 [Betaproteobacteria bacterium]|nr:hypothetical protein [Betaproteobacteria bacterium]